MHAFLRQRRAEQTQFLAALVGVPSDNPPGDCQPIADAAAQLLEGLGLAVERHPIAPDRVAANGMISATNLVVRHRFGPGPTVALNAHGDVVAPGEGWTHPPYAAQIVDGVMYGRGVAVSKSDFATYTYALLALQQSGLPLTGTVELHFTFDEEAGGLIGPGYLIEQAITRPDFVISAGFAYGIVTAHNGCLHLEVEIAGRSAHAAIPSSGADALEAATTVLAELYSLRRELAQTSSKIAGIGSPQLTVGLISGGINTNVVPDRVLFRLDRRVIPEEDPVAVERELRARIETAAAAHQGIGCSVRRILLAQPFTPVAGQDRLVAAIQAHASKIMGRSVEPHGVPIYTDARLYSCAGIPTVLYGAGPRTLLEANGHRADERLVLEDLYRATEVVALALADLLGPEAR
ncbi:MAG TPA: M20/M25/M40 family metallo-hydrolase [Hyphomicrobiaceae bacterium]|nr:M20/M25/M40 family metallo-hydrolase [Hyphomicrobiaceae bacterium]